MVCFSLWKTIKFSPCHMTNCVQLSPLTYIVIMNACIFILVLFSLLISTVYALLHSLILRQLSFYTVLNPPFDLWICSVHQDVVFWYPHQYLVILPFLGLFYCILKLSTVFWGCYQWWEGIKFCPLMGCGSHLSVVSFFYRTDFSVYMSSLITDSSINALVASLCILLSLIW